LKQRVTLVYVTVKLRVCRYQTDSEHTKMTRVSYLKMLNKPCKIFKD